MHTQAFCIPYKRIANLHNQSLSFQAKIQSKSDIGMHGSLNE